MKQGFAEEEVFGTREDKKFRKGYNYKMWQKTKNHYHLLRSIFSNVWYGFPSRNLIMIGATGTDGKTTTVNIIYHILNTGGLNPSMISSVGAVIDGKQYDLELHRTTPAAWGIQRFIKMAKKAGSKYLVLETTSHALDQNRTWGINFEVGVLTNITQEHLDYHKTYENYVYAKAKLFKKSKKSIINKDDKSYKLLKNLNFSNLTTYGFSKDADVNPQNIGFDIKIPGDFNKYNALAAIASCRSLGISEEIIKKGIQSFELPIGRMEEIYKGNFRIMIDFAHTPNSFEKLLSAIREGTKGRIIHVFGSAGKRDFAKRPLMGKASSKYADIIILTAEDPRGESVDKINSDIEHGISSNFSYTDNIDYVDNSNNQKIFFKIGDRNEAIKFAVGIAKKGDLVVCTGKSHERSMNYGKGEEPWDEFAVSRQALKDKLNI